MQGTLVQSQSKKGPYATEQLSPREPVLWSLHTTTAGPRAPLEPVLQEKPPLWKACAPQLARSPHSLQLEKAHTAAKTQCSQKEIFFSYFIYRKKTEAVDTLSSIYCSPFPLGTSGSRFGQK